MLGTASSFGGSSTNTASEKQRNLQIDNTRGILLNGNAQQMNIEYKNIQV